MRMSVLETGMATLAAGTVLIIGASIGDGLGYYRGYEGASEELRQTGIHMRDVYGDERKEIIVPLGDSNYAFTDSDGDGNFTLVDNVIRDRYDSELEAVTENLKSE